MLARKKVLCSILNRMERFFGEDFEFSPLAYMLPEEENEYEEDRKINPKQWYIAKPSKGA